MTFAEDIQRVVDAMNATVATIENEMIPTMEELRFQVFRSTIDYLLAEPWYRHLRLRWALRGGYQPAVSQGWLLSALAKNGTFSAR